MPRQLCTVFTLVVKPILRLEEETRVNAALLEVTCGSVT